MKNTGNIRGVVFDFNGTLFWDTEIHNKAWDIFLEKYSINLTDIEKNAKIHGKNNKEILTGLFSAELSDAEIDTFSIEKEKIYQELCLETDMQLAPGANDFLSFLVKKSIPFTIATASGIENVDFYYKHLFLDAFFDRSKIIYNDGTIKSKPHPQIFKKAMKILGINSDETLIFEDSFSGITAAEKACVSKIIIVDSSDNSYDQWDYQRIKDFGEVNISLFDV